jgi:hypothetical protein
MSTINKRQREEEGNEGNEPSAKRYKSASRLDRIEERVRNKLGEVRKTLDELRVFVPRGPFLRKGPSSAPAERFIATSNAHLKDATPITKTLANDFEIDLGVVFPLEFANGHSECKSWTTHEFLNVDT